MRNGSNICSVLLLTILAGAVTGCPRPGAQCPDLGQTPTLASDWVGFVDWDQATVATMSAQEVSASDFNFTPSRLEFTAGRPYVVRMQSALGNQSKHYFHAPEFYKSGATRKAQTSHAEYKAPYFDDFELKINGELDFYFIPVIAGTYDLWCTIPGHQEAGMEGDFKTVCGDGLALELEVDPGFDFSLATDVRRSGSHSVWDTAETIVVTMGDDSKGEFAFDPPDITLTANQAYILTIDNPSSNFLKHYYTAAAFYKTVVTRKAEDAQAEIKVPYFNAIELLIGGTTKLFIVPTVPGVYPVICTVPGHQAAGMEGTITVVE